MSSDDNYDYKAKFEKYCKKITKASNVSDDEKLFLYAHYKQAIIGNNNKEKPSFFNFTENEKWKAWDALKDMSQENAMKIYIKKVKEICHREGVK